MDNALCTPTEAGTQAQGMDLLRERVDLVEPEPTIGHAVVPKCLSEVPGYGPLSP